MSKRVIQKKVINLSDEYLNKIREIIAENSTLEKRSFIVFGSRSRGDNRPNSDIDIAIDGSAPISIEELSKIEDGLYWSDIPYNIDLVDLNRADNMIRQIAKTEGILLFDEGKGNDAEA